MAEVDEAAAYSTKVPHARRSEQILAATIPGGRAVFQRPPLMAARERREGRGGHRRARVRAAQVAPTGATRGQERL